MAKIFIGLYDIASQISDWKKGFSALGFETLTATLRKQHIVQRNEVDIDISKSWQLSYRGVRPKALQAHLQDKWHFAKNKVFKRALKECDIFIFIGAGFYEDYSDFKAIKEKGKKLICIFTGDDCRWYYCMKQEFEMYGMHTMPYEPGYDYSTTNLKSHLTHLRSAEKYADLIVSIPNQAQMALRPYYLFKCAVDLDMFPHRPVQRKIPKIIHAPSSPHFKGTSHFLDAVAKLKNEGVSFDFELIQGIPNKEAIQKYADADIILNQLFCPCGGKLAHEGMALGKVVLTRMAFDKNYDEQTPEGCPLVDVSPENIYEVLREIIYDLPRRQRLAEAGRPYVEKNNAVNVVSQRLLDMLEDNNRFPHFIPSFFKDHFVPESETAIPIYNDWNRYVSGSGWYKQYVGFFERGRLIF